MKKVHGYDLIELCSPVFACGQQPSRTLTHRRRDREGVTVGSDVFTWRKPVHVNEVRRALEIERELDRERALDGEFILDGELILDGERTLDGEKILEESRALEPSGELRYRSGSDDQLQPESRP
jgi:hypothetical protein